MYNHRLYFAYWIVNAAVLFLVSLVPETKVVLGNWRFSSLESAFYAGFWLTFLFWVWWDFTMARGWKSGNTFFTFVFFFGVNSFSVWAISLFRQFIGFQLQEYYWALAIGFIITILQGAVWNVIVRRR